MMDREYASPQVTRLRLGQQPDVVRFLPTLTPKDSYPPFLAATWDYDSHSSFLHALYLTPPLPSSSPTPSFSLHSLCTWERPGRGRITRVQASPLSESHSLVLASSSTGDLSLAVANFSELLEDEMRRCMGLERGRGGGRAVEGAGGEFEFDGERREIAARVDGLHAGAIGGIDFQLEAGECLTVGRDGKILAVKVEQWAEVPAVLADLNGAVAFSDVRWTAATEFMTGSEGGGVQWWDRRSPLKPTATASLGRPRRGRGPARVSALDVHPSRKYLCLAAGSDGLISAWDLRSPTQTLLPLLPPGVDRLPGGDIWDVRFDHLLHLWDLSDGRPDSQGVPPVLSASEDGSLLAIQPGGITTLFKDYFAINTFDVESNFGEHVICGLEDESLVHLYRHADS